MIFQALKVSASALMLAGAGGGAHATQASDYPSWLEGCWQYEDSATREVWASELGQILFGYSVSQNEEGLSAFEDMRIEREGAEFVFFASPNGRPAVQFKSVEAALDRIVFENRDHDFPQRIAYHRSGDRLTAVISDLERSTEYRFEMSVCVP